MGSWYENMKNLKKPDYIIIKRGTKDLEITLQYKNKQKYLTIDEEVSFRLKGVNVVVEKGERWGDWGGAIKCGDVISVHSPDKKYRDTRPEKVSFT